MAEYPRLSTKAEEVLRKLRLMRHVDWLIDDLERMTSWARACNIPRVLLEAGEARDHYKEIMDLLDEASAKDMITVDEWDISTSALKELRDRYIEITVNILKERCGCSRW